MKKIGRNEKCPCGSGKKYKQCCLGKRNNEAELETIRKSPTKINHMMSKIEIKQCLHPNQQECSKIIIDAHSIQNNRILNKLAVEGHVITLRPEVGKDALMDVIPKPKGRSTATTFTGFCGKHDKVTFAPIEDHEYVGTPQQNFLFAYRAHAYEVHKKNEAKKAMSQLIKMMPEYLNDHWFMAQYEGYEVSHDVDIDYYTKVFNEALLSDAFDVIETVELKFNGAAEIAVTSAFFLESDLKGNKLNNIQSLDKEPLKMLTLTVFPKDNETYALVSWLKEHAEFYRRFKEQLLALNPSEQLTYLNNLIPAYCENFVISPRLWDSFDKETKEELEFLFFTTTFLKQEDFLRVNKYDLFKGVTA